MGLLNAVKDLRTVRQLLTKAEAEALRAGEELPGPEHLLLSALELPDGSAVRAFERVGADPSALRKAIESAHHGALAAAGFAEDEGGLEAPVERRPAPGVFRSTPQAQQVFQQAVALSKSTRPSLLRSAHVVAATCTLERGTVVRALTALGVDRARLKAAACAEVGIPG
ncbi:Clp protease N-terminal domain-containing protein [Corallococcus sicarius]|uniref:Clp protease n=1 Tax=Corallococcus sicarius TaxID=2316726 RepID=A0A3A8NR47_9BACT|nr:Clp protease N-terminal domain-containing protein [Corallococcus sicarius]RKH45969.1 Clp protease [Corallococcus sicarius]